MLFRLYFQHISPSYFVFGSHHRFGRNLKGRLSNSIPKLNLIELLQKIDTMKALPLILLTTLTIFTLHSQNIEGTYSNKWISNSGEGIEYVLTLNEDGNFTFNYIRMYMDSDSDTKIEVQGTWVLENQLLVLNTDDGSEKENSIASGLNSNKARFLSVSPRNPKFKLGKSSLKFYKSDIFYAKDMKLIKTAPTVTAVE
jgi:hypothetical protein